jgi:hypothetical protein
MICKECGAEIAKGGFYCGGCGRPVGFDGPTVLTSDEPGLDDVPAPTTSRETPAGLGEFDPSVPRSTVSGKALCSMCMGAYPETVMTVVDGKPFCPDCSPLTAQRREPEVVAVDTGSEALAPQRSFERPATTGVFIPDERMGGGGLKGLFAILVLVLLGGAGFAAFTMLGSDRIDALMKGVDDSRTDARLMIQKYEAGEEIVYEAKAKLELNADLDGAMMSGGGSIEGSGTLYGGMRINVLGVDDRGNANLRMTFENFDLDLDVEMDGRPIGGMLPPDLLGEVNGQSFELRVDPFGDALGPPTGLAPGGPFGSMDEFFNGMVEGVPRHELRVGDTWSATDSVPLDPTGATGLGAGGFGFTANYRVEGYKRLAGRDCMVISLEGGLDGMPAGAGNPLMAMMDMDMDMTIKGVVFYDHEAGRMVKAAVDVKAEMSMSGQGNSVDLDMTLTLDVDLR